MTKPLLPLASLGVFLKHYGAELVYLAGRCTVEHPDPRTIEDVRATVRQINSALAAHDAVSTAQSENAA